MCVAVPPPSPEQGHLAFFLDPFPLRLQTSKIRLLANDVHSSLCYATYMQRNKVTFCERELIVYQASHVSCTTPSPRFSYRAILLATCYAGLILLFAACASSQGASSTSTPVSSPVRTPTAAIPTLSNALITYKGHSGPVIGVAWSPNGKWLVSCGNDGTVQEWDAQSGAVRWNVRVDSFAFAVAWSPNGAKIAAGGGSGSVFILDATTGHTLATYQGHITFIEGLAWSPDSKYVASGSQDDTVKVWNIQTGKAIVTYSGHNEAVNRVAWSPDGTRIASASHDGTVQVWEAKTGKQLLTYKDHAAPVWEVAWSPDGKYIVSGTGAAGNFAPVTSNNSVKVWNATTGQTLLTYNKHSGQVYALAWSPDGKSIASGGDDHSVRVWNIATGQTTLVYRGHSNSIFKIAWSPDGKSIASASADGTIQVWHLQA